MSFQYHYDRDDYRQMPVSPWRLVGGILAIAALMSMLVLAFNG